MPAWLSPLLWELGLLVLAFLLSALIGAERQRQLKSAGLRTHTLVGLGAAVFTLVSAYGFAPLPGIESASDTLIQVDPSRIAAQVVSGIGFLGAGVIFVRQNIVNGLTTAASIWVTASIGMASGAGMPALAVLGTGLYLVTTTLLSRLGRRIRPIDTGRVFTVRYKERRGILRQILASASAQGYQSTLLNSKQVKDGGKAARIEVDLRFSRSTASSFDQLLESLAGIRGVVSVSSTGSDPD